MGALPSFARGSQAVWRCKTSEIALGTWITPGSFVIKSLSWCTGSWRGIVVLNICTAEIFFVFWQLSMRSLKPFEFGFYGLGSKLIVSLKWMGVPMKRWSLFQMVACLQVDRVIRRLDKELESIVNEIGHGKASATDKAPRKFCVTKGDKGEWSGSCLTRDAPGFGASFKIKSCLNVTIM